MAVRTVHVNWRCPRSGDHCWSLLALAGSVDLACEGICAVSFGGHLLLGSVAKLLLDPVDMVLCPKKSIQNYGCWWGQGQKQLRSVSSISV